jgi:uncharacterized membrane protein YgcG
MQIRRWFRHLFTTRWHLNRAFDAETRQAIEQAITETEKSHRGELRFAVEADLGIWSLLGGETAEERSLDMFANLGVWDTEDNSGILIYVLLADHHVAIVADRGYRDHVTHEQWRGICARMEAAFRGGDFRRGAIEGVLGAARYAAEFFPLDGENPNELPNEMVFL